MTTQSVFSSNAHGQKANASSDQSRDIPQRLLGVRPAAWGTSETPALEEQQLVQRPSFRKRRLPGPGGREAHDKSDFVQPQAENCFYSDHWQLTG